MTGKFAAIVTGPDTHLDHLAVICYVMNMPLIVTNREVYESAKVFYPQVQTVFKDLSELNAPFLVSQFDAVFETERFFVEAFAPMIQLLSAKKVRFIYCPHGNSDKDYSKQGLFQDVSLVYGQHMLDLLTRAGSMERIGLTIRTGNYRRSFYEKYRSFYDELIKKHVVKNRDPYKKTILYAPTWQDGESVSSFFNSTGRLVLDLSKDFNLMIKLHPFLRRFHPEQTENILQKYSQMPGVVFLDQFPLVYPILQISDLYIGDYSSIGYDFLAFDKPIYFLKEEIHSPSSILPCGLCIPKNEDVSAFIQDTLQWNQSEKSDIRKSTYLYAFGEQIPFFLLKETIVSNLSR